MFREILGCSGTRLGLKGVLGCLWGPRICHEQRIELGSRDSGFPKP